MKSGRVLDSLIIMAAFLLFCAAGVDYDDTLDEKQPSPYWTVHIETEAESCDEIDTDDSNFGESVEFTVLEEEVGGDKWYNDWDIYFFPPEGFAF